MMFMISEVHPFDDGNGRTGRIMMNAELVANNEYRIIIPNIYHNNYLSALRAMTNNGYAEALLKALNFAQKYTQMIDWSDFDTATQMLNNTHAFMDSNQADEDGIRLELPGYCLKLDLIEKHLDKVEKYCTKEMKVYFDDRFDSDRIILSHDLFYLPYNNH